MSSIFRLLSRSAAFAVWSVRRRMGQIVPVAVALLLLVCAAQAIGALHDVSSVLTQQQIAQNWRGPYDVLVRPPSAVSQIEHNTGWIDPQSALETYGGISTQQVSSIRGLGHVVQVVPFATMGWQSVEVLVPVELPQMGVYRISASWKDQGNDVVRYVDVTDLSHLTTEVPITHPSVQHLLGGKGAAPITFTMPVQAIQAVIGVPMAQLANIREELLKGIAPVPALHLSLHVERLRGDLSMLPACTKGAAYTGYANCWQLVSPGLAPGVRQGSVSYGTDGVQLIHYSHTLYSASPQQLAAGQVSMNALGNDVQGPIYRLPFPVSQDAPALTNAGNLTLASLASPALLPFSMPEHLPLLANAVRFVPIEQACTANAGDCYSGLYVRLDGVEHYSQQSLALLQATAAAIVARTGLHVDILDGSSWRSVLLKFSLGSSTSGLQSMWRVVGVAVQIVHGVDTLQETLLVLCSAVCLLAIGAAGVLVGVGRRKDALMLQQLGWHRSALLVVFTLDALLLCVPGCILAIGWIVLVTYFWPGILPPSVMWVLLGIGVFLYGCVLVVGAFSGTRKMRNQRKMQGGHNQGDDSLSDDGLGNDGQGDRKGRPYYTRNTKAHPSIALRCIGHRRPSSASRGKFIGLLVYALATTCAVFLIAEGYILMTGLNSELVVTLLGRQVHEVLEGPQLALLLVMISAALLTVALCTRLLLQARREELHLLSMVGWERGAVHLRILRESWWPALLSGGAGTLLALGLAVLATAMPSVLIVLALLICGPLVGVLLVSLPTLGIAWQETERLYAWR